MISQFNPSIAVLHWHNKRRLSGCYQRSWCSSVNGLRNRDSAQCSVCNGWRLKCSVVLKLQGLYGYFNLYRDWDVRVSLNCSNLSSPPKLFFQLALINWKSRVVCHKPQLHHLYLQVSYHNYGQVQRRKNWSKAIISRYRFQDGCLTCFYNIMEKQHSHFPFEVKS